MEAGLKARTPTRADYDAAFERERAMAYPAIDNFEQRMGFAVDRARLEAAARVLACPVKRNPPSWQHGRVIYAAARRYLTRRGMETSLFLDIGTAKGFSAVVMAWAIADSGASGYIESFDVVDPNARQRRNSVADLDDPLKTVWQLTRPFVLLSPYFGCSGSAAKEARGDRIHFAFVDGKHTFEAVTADAAGIKARQQPGDVIIFDDLQIPGVDDAVGNLSGYTIERLACKPERQYAIATRA